MNTSFNYLKFVSYKSCLVHHFGTADSSKILQYPRALATVVREQKPVWGRNQSVSISKIDPESKSEMI